MSKAPAFQFYPSDFISDPTVQMMSNAEIGVYLKMLCFDWIGDGIPTDVERLFNLLDCNESELSICLEKFEEIGGRYYNKRLRKEREKQLNRREQASAAGRASGRKRAEKRTTVERPLNDRSIPVERKSNPISSSSSSPSVREKSKPKKSPQFKRPTVEEVTEYSRRRAAEGKPAIDPQKFVNHYDSNGWKVGRNPMKSWQAAVRTWEGNDIGKGGSFPSQTNSQTDGLIQHGDAPAVDVIPFQWTLPTHSTQRSTYWPKCPQRPPQTPQRPSYAHSRRRWHSSRQG